MTPKEKCDQLIEKMYNQNQPYTFEIKAAKQCAKIAVEEVLYGLQVPPIENKGHLLYDSQIDYWNEVLTHLNT